MLPLVFDASYEHLSDTYNCDMAHSGGQVSRISGAAFLLLYSADPKKQPELVPLIN